MNDITLLSYEQIFEEDRLDIFKKYGTKAAMTDFAILLGGYVSGELHAPSGNDLKDRTGFYWTKSSAGDGHVHTVNIAGSRYYSDPYERYTATRPVSLYSDINLISKDVVNGSLATSEIEYGEYPQKAVNKELKESLEKEYSNSRLKATGKLYTTDSKKYNEYDKAFEAQVHDEFEYSGKRYIRLKANLYARSVCNGNLSNGSIVKNGDYVWVEVEPITWLVDEKTGIVISKKLLFSGVRFDGKVGYDGDFESTEMKKFLDNYFSKEIEVVASKAIEPTIEEKEFETEEELDDYIASKLAEARKRLTLLGKN